MKERDAALEYNESSLSELSEVVSTPQSSRKVDADAGAALSASSPGNLTRDIAERLNELEQLMAASNGGTPDQKAAAKEARDALSGGISTNAADTQGIAKPHNNANSPGSRQDEDLESKLARLEKVLADSPKPSPDTELKTAQLSVSALAQSATGTMDDELTNRLDRLEELLGPMDSPPADPHRPHRQAAGLSTGIRGRLGIRSFASGASTPGNVSDVDAHLARLDKLIGTSSPTSTIGGTGARKPGYGSTPKFSASNSAKAAIARGAELENQALRDRIVELESMLDARGGMLEDMMLSSSGRGDPRPYGDPGKEMGRLRRAEASAKRALVSAEASLSEAHAEISRLKKEQRQSEASLRAEIEGLHQQLNHSEHRVRARETMIETLQDRLQVEVRKAAQERERDRKVFAKVHGRSPRKGSPSDAKTGEIIAMYETQRRGMEVELASLRRDVRRLTMEVRDTENAKQRSRQTGGKSDVDVDFAAAERAGTLAKNLESETRRVQERAESLRRKEEQITAQVARMREELGTAQEQHEKLLEVNTNLKMELESRPTMRDWKRLQRMVELLQEKLRDAVDGEAARDDKERAGLRRVAGDDTSSLVKRDRENHRLRLHTLDALSRSSSIELLKSVCRILGIGGGKNGTSSVAYQIEPAVERIQQVVLAVPRMQAFVREVCKSMRVNPGTTLGVAMELALKQLRVWENDRNSFKALQMLRVALVNELCTRQKLSTEGGTLPEDFGDDARILAEVKGMITEEGKAEAKEKYYAEAEESMGSAPKELINRIVAHFIQIFDVKSGVRGVLPKMNEVFLFTSEQNTFMAAARAMLGLSDHATTAAVMSEFRERMGSETENGSQKDSAEKKDGRENSNLVEERRTAGGTAFTVTRRGVPSWSVEN